MDLSNLSLNTYQNESVLHIKSKQVIFLMWAWLVHDRHLYCVNMKSLMLMTRLSSPYKLLKASDVVKVHTHILQLGTNSSSHHRKQQIKPFSECTLQRSDLFTSCSSCLDLQLANKAEDFLLLSYLHLIVKVVKFPQTHQKKVELEFSSAHEWDEHRDR